MKRGQVWIETVIYTLIGLALIGLVLAIVMPKINNSRDRIVVEQSIDALNKFDIKFSEALNRGQGNTRTIDPFTMRRGEFFVNSSGDSIVMIIKDLNNPYSEIGEVVKFGRVKIISTEGQKSYSVILTLDYSNLANVTYNKRDIEKKFSSSTTP